MEKIFYIKNMVCDRCKQVLRTEFNNASISFSKVDLGEVVVNITSEKELLIFKNIIITNGFEIASNETDLQVEKMKELLQDRITIQTGFDVKISEYIATKLHKEYSVLSKMFSTNVGVTIEKYVIYLKIEKAKELIQMGQLSFSEIAYSLNYKSSSHLAKQFKLLTGFSMTTYKTTKNWNRKTLDKIV
ncbi:AraC-like DNA-binding protein [Wenyingzhuangia heitensis]|uniref:AraC-like DNA-binding protein n=1 Tax=Wenyingzhuangia heitensis TaxID=1487859 RepID=A0ABX0UH72_9FLAO|nr:AraC family transcriptional regulator [Wenyingzhuangia heitensis]NIJ46367.1 AraC-like DNA-binding protein [Wenyingzhuangia heitensis]